MTTESGTPPDAGKSGQQQQPTQSGTVANPWEGVDLDDLPEEVRTKLEAAKTAYATTTAKLSETEQQKTAAENFARQNQSRADKAVSVLQRHNLSIDGNSGVQPQLTESEQLRAKFIKDGLKEDAADAYVKMFETNNNVQRQRILQEFGPLANTVAGIQATQILSGAKSAHAEIFAVPSVEKHINDNIQTLLQNGTPVDQSTIDHLMDMAWGKYLRENPGATTKSNTVTQQVPQFGANSITTGGYVNQLSQAQQSGAPVAKHAETIPIVSAIVAEMRRGLPVKKGGK